jgi:hypothetical protein
MRTAPPLSKAKLELADRLPPRATSCATGCAQVDVGQVFLQGPQRELRFQLEAAREGVAVVHRRLGPAAVLEDQALARVVEDAPHRDAGAEQRLVKPVVLVRGVDAAHRDAGQAPEDVERRGVAVAWAAHAAAGREWKGLYRGAFPLCAVVFLYIVVVTFPAPGLRGRRLSSS